jgi:ATP-dependent Clp protease ATP-binding subunit ClpA
MLRARELREKLKNETFGFGPRPKKIQGMDQQAADARIKAACLGAVEDFFSPEFINRIDEIVTFHPLIYDHLMAILEKFLAETKERVAQTGFVMSLSESAKRFLIEKGTNLRYGARPLRRAVREYLEFPLANVIAECDFTDRKQAVQVEAGDNELLFYFAKLAQGALTG